MAKVTAKLSKQNSVQSLQNLEREINRWSEVLHTLAVKRNDATAAKLTGLFQQVQSAIETMDKEFISDEARSIHADKLATAKVKAALKAGKAVVESDDEDVDL